MLDFLSSLTRRFRRPGWTLIDPRPIREEAPYTFHIPSSDTLASVKIGDCVKVIFEGTGGDAYDVERMWVEVDGRDDRGWTGRLSNVPFGLRAIQLDDTIQFQDYHIIDVDPLRLEDEDPVAQGAYFARCHVAQDIIDGKDTVQRIERREPRAPDPNTDIQDTGLFLFGTKDTRTEDMAYVALGAVLNRDDSMLGILMEDRTSVNFIRDASGSFIAE